MADQMGNGVTVAELKSWLEGLPDGHRVLVSDGMFYEPGRPGQTTYEVLKASGNEGWEDYPENVAWIVLGGPPVEDGYQHGPSGL